MRFSLASEHISTAPRRGAWNAVGMCVNLGLVSPLPCHPACMAAEKRTGKTKLADPVEAKRRHDGIDEAFLNFEGGLEGRQGQWSSATRTLRLQPSKAPPAGSMP